MIRCARCCCSACSRACTSRSRCPTSAASTRARTSTARTRLSTGTVFPEKPTGSEFSGACVPTSVLRDVQGPPGRVLQAPARALRTATAEVPGGHHPVQRRRRASLRHLLHVRLPSAVPPAGGGHRRGPGGRRVGRRDAPRRRASRCSPRSSRWPRIAVRRAPRGKWAFATVALVPVALFQASASLSHDAMTLGISLVVVSSAFARARSTVGHVDARVGDRGVRAERAARDVQAGLRGAWRSCTCCRCCGASVASPPWPIALAPVVAGVVTVVWNAIVGGLWKTDAGDVRRGGRPRTPTPPPRHRALALRGRGGRHGRPTRPGSGSAPTPSVGGSVTDWPAIVGVVGSLVLLLVALQTSRECRQPPRGVVTRAAARDPRAGGACSPSARSTCTGARRATPG